MSSFHIEDGTGSGNSAKVNDNNRLETYSFGRSDAADNSIRSEQSYEFASGAFVTLATDVNEHAIFYLKNTSTTKSLLVGSIRACGTAPVLWTMYKNDTGGDLISDANAGTEANHNFRSTNVADADVWAASGSGKTRSGGSWLTQFINNTGHSTEEYDGYLILGANNSLTMTATNATSVASTRCCVRIHAYYEEI
jgi:hypothetical protein